MKSCEQCCGGFEKRPKEARWQFEERRFCSKRCAGLALNPRLPNGEFKARYRRIKVDGKTVSEHRHVMEQMLGRPLRSDEQVHHINHDGLDNRPENLELVTAREHGLRHSKHPRQKPCQSCGEVFTPHPTKRKRAKTCGHRECIEQAKRR